MDIGSGTGSGTDRLVVLVVILVLVLVLVLVRDTDWIPGDGWTWHSQDMASCSANRMAGMQPRPSVRLSVLSGSVPRHYPTLHLPLPRNDTSSRVLAWLPLVRDRFRLLRCCS